MGLWTLGVWYSHSCSQGPCEHPKHLGDTQVCRDFIVYPPMLALFEHVSVEDRWEEGRLSINGICIVWGVYFHQYSRVTSGSAFRNTPGGIQGLGIDGNQVIFIQGKLAIFSPWS